MTVPAPSSQECEHRVALGFAYCYDCGTQIYRAGNRKPFPHQIKRQRKQIAAIYGTICMFCGNQPNGTINGNPYQFTIDHIIPTSKGGANTIWNTIPACVACNSLKSNMFLDEWLPSEVERITAITDVVYHEYKNRTEFLCNNPNQTR